MTRLRRILQEIRKETVSGSLPEGVSRSSLPPAHLSARGFFSWELLLVAIAGNDALLSLLADGIKC